MDHVRAGYNTQVAQVYWQKYTEWNVNNSRACPTSSCLMLESS